MGSFRSAAARATDIDTLTPEDRPEKVDPADWLQPGEWVRYVTKLGHHAAVRLADEGTIPVLDRRGKKVTDVKIRAGTLSQIKLEEGIVDWSLSDEDGKAVRWDKALAGTLIEGLPNAVRQALSNKIGSAAPDTDDDGEPDETGQKQGNA